MPVPCKNFKQPEIAPDQLQLDQAYQSELTVSRKSTLSFSLHEEVSTNASRDLVYTSHASCLHVPESKMNPKIRDLKRARKSRNRNSKLIKGVPLVPKQSNLEDECERCTKIIDDRHFINENALCDVGAKAVFRCIRRRCNEQYQLLLQSREAKHDMQKGLEALV